MRDTIKRWAEAVGQNLLASGIWVAAIALGAVLLSKGGKDLNVEVWWLAIGVFIFAALLFWLVVLTGRIADLRAQLERLSQKPQTEAHTHQYLLDQIRAMTDQLGRMEHWQSPSWETGYQLNLLIEEAAALDARVNLQQTPRAEPDTYNGEHTRQTAGELMGILDRVAILVRTATVRQNH